MKAISPADHAATVRDLHSSLKQPHIKPVSAPLYVICAISNPMRYRVRYEHYRAFEKMVGESGAILITVELALRDSHFEVTSASNPHHVQLRSPDIMWVKENLQNCGLRAVPSDAEYIGMLDTDLQYARSDWATEAVHMLQRHRIVQGWTHNISLGPDNQPIAQATSLIYNWQQNAALLQPWSREQNKALPKPGFNLKHHPGDHGSHVHQPPEHGQADSGLLHTGYSWFYRRSALADLGGLGEAGVLGSGDRHMAYSLIGEVERSFPAKISEGYKRYWRRWEQRANKYINGNVGVVSALILDGWHASKKFRRYQDRWSVLTKHAFDPYEDIYQDGQGVLRWSGDKPALEADCKQYFKLRNEDSIDL